LKIEVDQTVADEWIELDAVEVIGSVTGMYLLSAYKKRRLALS
jgi:hypothetical protein